MANMLNPQVVPWDVEAGKPANGPYERVTPAAAQGLVDAGTHQWGAGHLREFVHENAKDKSAAKKTAAKKPAAKKKAKKK
jgi:topoisomerase IA-like protein